MNANIRKGTHMNKTWKPKDPVLVLRSCRIDGTSQNGFTWPKKGYVEAPDFDPKPVCGKKLHGLLLGQNNPGAWYDLGIVQVVQVERSEIITGAGDLVGKCGFPRCLVVYSGDMVGASAYFEKHGSAEGLYGRVSIGGDGSILTGGYGSILTGGDRSTLTGGHCSTLTEGHGSKLTGGRGST